MKDNVLVQRIEHSNGDFDLSYLIDFTYTEKLDLSAPIIVMTISDRYEYLRDDLGVQCRDELKITLHDPQHSGEMSFTEMFVVESMPVDSLGNVEINCTSSVLDDLKSLSKSAFFYKKKPPSMIIRDLVDSDRFNIGVFPAINDYHLLPSMRKSKLIRQMAQELGARSFYRRGEMVFKSISDILNAPPSLPPFSFGDPSNGSLITSYTSKRNKTLIAETSFSNYSGFDLIDGFVDSGIDAPNKPTGLTSKSSLANLSKSISPAVSFITGGNGGVMVGDIIDVIWSRLDRESPVNESLPERGVVYAVSHYYASNRYICKITMGEIVDGV